LSLNINKKEIENVINLDASKRYNYFIKRVADTATLWGLYSDGWALVRDEDGRTLLPMWPAPEYADLCAKDEWKGYKPEPIEVHDFLEGYIQELAENNIDISVFYTPFQKGINPSYEKIKKDLEAELSKIEE
jgi:hypothetical protein